MYKLSLCCHLARKKQRRQPHKFPQRSCDPSNASFLEFVIFITHGTSDFAENKLSQVFNITGFIFSLISIDVNSKVLLFKMI